MTVQPLDFELPIADLERRVAELAETRKSEDPLLIAVIPSSIPLRSSERLPEPEEGRKPPKKNGTGGRPLPTRAVVTALGPGRTV